jgi:hypothetical protein
MGSSRRFPSHEAEITIPGEPIVFTYYAGRGVQFQPFESFKHGNRLIKQAQPDVEQARIVADRMLQLSRTRSLMTTWEYFFPFGGPARPWTSAISQANGINFYSRLGELLGPASGARYTAVATRMSRAFLRSSSKGGVVSAQGTGHFYVMYSFHPRQRILNGHLQALLDTYRLWERTGSATAKLAYDKGYAAIAPMLRRFDTGGWSNYQLGQEADLEYHEFMTKQLTDLAEMTGAPIFQTYAARFQSHLTTAPIVTFPKAGFPAIVAVRDGYRDTTTVGYRVNKRSRVTMLVRDADGHEVWRGTTRHGRGAGSLTWRGITNAGARAPYGTYTARLTATDIAGNRRSIDTPSKLRILRDESAPSPGLIAVKRHPRGALVTVRAFDGGSAWVDVLVRVGGKTVASRRGPRVGTSRIVVSKPLARVLRGSILLRDSSGNVTRVPLSN